MKAYEFPVKVSAEGTPEIPAFVSNLLSKKGVVGKVIIFLSESETASEQKDWDNFAVGEFFHGYSNSDSIYDTN